MILLPTRLSALPASLSGHGWKNGTYLSDDRTLLQDSHITFQPPSAPSPPRQAQLGNISTPHPSRQTPPIPSTTPTLKLLQLNCHVSKETTLSVLHSSPDYFFLILQEPWINPFTLSPPEHQEWRVFTAFEHCPLQWSNRHRVCVYIKRDIPSMKIKQLSDCGQFLLGLDVTLPSSKTIRILNVYNTPRTFPALELLQNWLKVHNSRQVPTLLCMDANLHHPNWNPPGI